MLISSTLRVDNVSSSSFIVLHHRKGSVLLPVDIYEKYSDLSAFAEKEWELKQQNIIFETDELNICPGKLVRIHEQAWYGVKDIIGNLYVREHDPKEEIDKKDSRRVSAIKRGTRTASRSESADEDEVEQETRPDSQRSEYVIVPSSQPPQREEPSSTQPSPGSSDQAKSGGDALNLFSDEVGSKDGSTHGSRSSDNDRETERSEEQEISRTKENTRRSPTASNGSTTTPSAPASTSEPERVLIIVEVAGGGSEARGFRIKREHTIYTVLKGASKSFNVDVAKAVLKKVVEDDDGELSFVKCNSTDTMRSLQIEDGQRFIIELTESEEEESEESDD